MVLRSSSKSDNKPEQLERVVSNAGADQPVVSKYKSKFQKLQDKIAQRKEIEGRFVAAKKAWFKGDFTFKRKCASAFNLSEASLRRHLKADIAVGSGRRSKLFTPDEEEKIVKLGYGVNFVESVSHCS